MNTHLTRLRRQCEPVQEDTPVPPREHRVSVDRRDLLQLLADYDAAVYDVARRERTYQEQRERGQQILRDAGLA